MVSTRRILSLAGLVYGIARCGACLPDACGPRLCSKSRSPGVPAIRSTLASTHLVTGSGKVIPIPRKATASDHPGPFVSKSLRALFAKAGYGAGGRNASRVISGGVRKFFVVEGSVYRATPDLSLTVRNRGGKVLRRGSVQGKSSTFGGSYRLDNFFGVRRSERRWPFPRNRID